MRSATVTGMPTRRVLSPPRWLAPVDGVLTEHAVTMPKSNEAKFRNLAPRLDETMRMIDETSIIDRYIELDYARFILLLNEVELRLEDPGLNLPDLNEGGSSKAFKDALLDLAVYARAGDLDGAPRSMQWRIVGRTRQTL